MQVPAQVDFWVVLVAGLIALLVGWLIGFLDSNKRNSRKVKAAEMQAQIRVEEAKRKVAEAEAAPSPAAPAGESLLRLWAGPDQPARLELDGAELAAPQSITPEQRRRLIAVLTQVRPWVEGKPAPLQAPAPAKPVPAAAPVLLPPAVEPVPAAIITGKRKTVEPLPPPKSIVQQIDEVLQKRLAGTQLGTRSIRLVESPSGAVNVFVGTNRYEGIEAVPDPEVVAALRAAVAEWETRAK